jgi:hypothetical protein
MPTIRKYRQWCKTCQDWTLHTINGETDQLICDLCKTENTNVYLDEIPNEKLLEQRARYNKKKYSFILDNVLLNPNNNPFAPVGSNIEIIETDAGQDYIDEQVKKRYEELQKKREEQDKLQAEHKKIGRNEKCFCGSGLKFKKCCYNKVFGQIEI